MKIYYRICEEQNTLSFVPRWQNKTKIEILKKCWLSLQQSVKSDDEILLIEDQCSADLVKWFEASCNTSNLEIHHINSHPKNEYPHYLYLVDRLDKDTKIWPDDLFYIANDDYLYLSNAMDMLKSIYKDGWEGFAVPYDYPDRYTLDKQYFSAHLRQCELFIGSMSHWRTVPSCPGITSAKGKIWQKHMTVVKQAAPYHQDSYTWLAYAQSGCLCPIPGVATHLVDSCMTPRIDWNKVWDEIKID